MATFNGYQEACFKRLISALYNQNQPELAERLQQAVFKVLNRADKPVPAKPLPFKVGDLVYLKSGSGKMVVETVHGSAGNVTCQWMQYGGDGTVFSGTFKPEVLRRA